MSRVFFLLFLITFLISMHNLSGKDFHTTPGERKCEKRWNECNCFNFVSMNIKQEIIEF